MTDLKSRNLKPGTKVILETTLVTEPQAGQGRGVICIVADADGIFKKEDLYLKIEEVTIED